MTENIFGENLFDIYFIFLVWPVSRMLKWRGWDLWTVLQPSTRGDPGKWAEKLSFHLSLLMSMVITDVWSKFHVNSCIENMFKKFYVIFPTVSDLVLF